MYNEYGLLGIGGGSVMALYEEQAEREESRKQLQETSDRITNPWNVQVEHFLEHQKVDGIFQSGESSMFQCDRILKMENSFIQLQMGYNPEQKRTFVVANTKTSRYDNISGASERKVREDVLNNMMQRKKKKQEGNGRKLAETMVFLHNKQQRIWTKNTIRSFLKESNEEVHEKTMPFFVKFPEMQKRAELRQMQKELKDEISENSRISEHQENTELNREARDYMQEENMLQALITRKETASNYFLRKINYALDTQKVEMFAYYKERQEAVARENANDDSVEDDEDES